MARLDRNHAARVDADRDSGSRIANTFRVLVLDGKVAETCAKYLKNGKRAEAQYVDPLTGTRRTGPWARIPSPCSRVRPADIRSPRPPRLPTSAQAHKAQRALSGATGEPRRLCSWVLLRFVDLRDQTVEYRVRIKAGTQQHHARMAHATRPLRFLVQLSEHALLARLDANRYIEHPALLLLLDRRRV